MKNGGSRGESEGGGEKGKDSKEEKVMLRQKGREGRREEEDKRAASYGRSGWKLAPNERR